MLKISPQFRKRLQGYSIQLKRGRVLTNWTGGTVPPVHNGQKCGIRKNVLYRIDKPGRIGIMPVDKNADSAFLYHELKADIQSAFAMPDERKMQQEQRPLIHTGDGFKKIIITKDALAPLYNEKGVLVMSIFDFLLNPDSLEL